MHKKASRCRRWLATPRGCPNLSAQCQLWSSGGRASREIQSKLAAGHRCQAASGQGCRGFCVAGCDGKNLDLQPHDRLVKPVRCAKPNLPWQYLRSLSRYNCLHTIRKHSAEVTDLSIHPLGEHQPHLLRMAACPILHRITELLPHGLLGQVLGNSRLSQRPLHTTHAGSRHPFCKRTASTPSTSHYVG